jgi:hypothetical protein
VHGSIYCEECLARTLAPPPPAQPAVHTDSHPGIALALGFIPGLGAVYNGEYIKGLVHVGIFGGLIALLTGHFSGGFEAFLGIALSCFYLYMPVEAFRTARARRAGEPATTLSTEVGEPGKPVGAIVLIVLGVLFLLANFGLLQREWFAKGWPIALIAIGIVMLTNRMRKNA